MPMTATTTNSWRNHTRANPCPICKKHDRCRFTEDGAQRCFRATEPPAGWRRIKQCKDGTGIYRRDETTKESNRRPAHKPRQAATSTQITIDWAAESAAMIAKLTPEQLQQIATDLGVSNAALQAIGCGWASEDDLR